MKRKLRNLRDRFLNSTESKVLAGNFGYMMVLQVAGYLFPLVTIPYLARVIGVEGFGKIAFAAAIILWFQTISDWGFNYTATRDIAQNRDNAEKVSEIFSSVLWARIILMLISFGVLLVAISTVPILEENKWILLITFLQVPGHIIFPEWFFQAVEKMRFITIFGLVTKAIFTGLVFLFVKERDDFILQPLFLSCGYMLCGIASMYLIVVKWKVKIKFLSLYSVFDTIRKSSSVFIMNLMPNFYYGFSTLFVGVVGGVGSNGILDAGRRFVGISEQFMNVVSRVFFPYLARNGNKHSAYLRISLFISVSAFLFLLIGAPTIIEVFFTPEFQPAILVLQISSLSLIFLSLRNVYGINYLVLRGYEKISRDIMISTSILGFCITFPFVYYLDYIGAAIVVVFIHAMQSVWMMVSAQRKMKFTGN